MERDTGVIRVAKSLDREEQYRYVLSVQAEDQALNTAHRLSSTAMVSIENVGVAIHFILSHSQAVRTC